MVGDIEPHRPTLVVGQDRPEPGPRPRDLGRFTATGLVAYTRASVLDHGGDRVLQRLDLSHQPCSCGSCSCSCSCSVAPGAASRTPTRCTVCRYLGSVADSPSLDVHLSWLRRKLGESATEPRYLQTVQRVGVRLAAPGATEQEQEQEQDPQEQG